MLRSNYLTSEEFSIGIKELNFQDQELLYESLKEEQWYQLHNTIFDKLPVVNESNRDIKDSFEFFARPYLTWITSQAEKMLKQVKYDISKKVIENLTDHLFQEVLSISKKTIIYDYQEEYQGNEFSLYAHDRFSEREGYQEFYNDYPVLARILVTRAKYALDNFREFVFNLDFYKGEIQQHFSIGSEFYLENVEYSKGDSHSQGKSVFIFSLSGRKLVYKYRNSEVGEQLNKFITYLETHNANIDLHKVSRISTEKFTIEEWIEYKPCISKEELSFFYRSFGQVVCLMYLLCGNDFHLENMIACGKYPVLIDVETLLHNKVKVNKDSAIYRYYTLLQDSVLGSSLLPSVYIYSDNNNQMEFSALAGNEQSMPYQILQLIQEETDRCTLEYRTSYMESACNIPTLNGKHITYIGYEESIIGGFKEVYDVIFRDKEKIRKKINVLFKNLFVRNIFKATQKYAEMLDFAYHPAYMNNYLNREKLLENIWAYPHDNPAIVRFEIDDLLVDDIPCFSNHTGQRSIKSSGGNIIGKIYDVTALEYVESRLDRLGTEDYQIQENYMSVSLGKFNGRLTKIKFGDSNVLSVKVKQIADYIYSRIIWSGSKQEICLSAYVMDKNKRWKLGYMSNTLFDGLGGIYLFYYYYCKLYEDNRYADLLKTLDCMFFKQIDEITNDETIIEYMSFLYILSCRLSEEFNQSDSLMGQKLLHEIQNYLKEHEMSDDWIYGKAGLICICLKFYRVSKFENSLLLAQKLADAISDNQSEIGFAHGYCGIAYSLGCLCEFLEGTERERIKCRIRLINKKVDVSMYPEMDNSWCHGLVGIGTMKMKNQLYVGDVFPEKSFLHVFNAEMQDDCICHGQFGALDFLEAAVKDNQKHYKELWHQVKARVYESKNEFSIIGLSEAPGLDFLTGLTGIAYGLMQQEFAFLPRIHLLE